MRNYNLGVLEIMDRDLEIKLGSQPFHRINFDEAESLALSMGNGWRFPTVKEAIFLKEYYEMKVLNFSREAYWISDREISGEPLPETVGGAYYFSMGRYGGIPKSERLRARLVRSI